MFNGVHSVVACISRCDREGSDVDIGALVSSYPEEWSFEKAVDFKTAINSSQARAECYVVDRKKVERWREFELCYEGQVMRGHVLYDANRQFEGEVLPRQAAKDEVVRHYFWQARQWIEKGKMHLKYCNDGGYRFPDEVLWESCRGACRCLHAVLTQHEIDFTPRVLRWNLPALSKKARKLEPALEKVAPYIEGLPKDVAFLDLEAVDGLDTNLAFTDLRASVVRALIGSRAVARCLGIKQRGNHHAGLFLIRNSQALASTPALSASAVSPRTAIVPFMPSCPIFQ